MQPFAPDAIEGLFGFLAAVQSFGNLAASAIVALLYTLASQSIAFAYAGVIMVVAVAFVTTTSLRSRIV